jgi:hypothetical protein
MNSMCTRISLSGGSRLTLLRTSVIQLLLIQEVAPSPLVSDGESSKGYRVDVQKELVFVLRECNT